MSTQMHVSLVNCWDSSLLLPPAKDIEYNLRNSINTYVCLSVNITSINSPSLIGVCLMLDVSFIPCHNYYFIVFYVTAYYGSFRFYSALCHTCLLRVFNEIFSIYSMPVLLVKQRISVSEPPFGGGAYGYLCDSSIAGWKARSRLPIGYN